MRLRRPRGSAAGPLRHPAGPRAGQRRGGTAAAPRGRAHRTARPDSVMPHYETEFVRICVLIVPWTCTAFLVVLPAGVRARPPVVARPGHRGVGAVRVLLSGGRAGARPGASGGALPGAGMPVGLVQATARAGQQPTLMLGKGAVNAACRRVCGRSVSLPRMPGAGVCPRARPQPPPVPAPPVVPLLGVAGTRQPGVWFTAAADAGSPPRP
jgi:hypothetical protein